MTDTVHGCGTTSADPLGPDSLTWKYFGDLRTGMLGVWIGAIQTGQQIKSYHHTIKGVDGAGHRYHALHPETFN